jgi:DNA-binding response OmpR family regulator
MPRVLLLEDDPLVLMMLSLELQADGFEVVQAETAREALALLDVAAAVFICDLDLRDRYDGYEVARAARAHNPAVAVLYTSGMGQPDFARCAVDGGELAAKPFLPQEIVRRVRGLVD